MTKKTYISKSFSLEEFTESATAKATGTKNEPNEEQIKNIQTLVDNLLQPVRNSVGGLKVSSGFRSSELNRLVGGVPTSNHLKGYAADVVPLATNISEVYDYIVNSGKFKYTECIWYQKRNFIHLSYDPNNVRLYSAVK